MGPSLKCIYSQYVNSVWQSHVHMTLTQIAEENVHGENWKVLLYLR